MPPNSRAHEPAMENESLGEQQGNTLHGTRDIIDSADFNWSELARAPQYEVKGRKYYKERKALTAAYAHNCWARLGGCPVSKANFEFIITTSIAILVACLVGLLHVVL